MAENCYHCKVAPGEFHTHGCDAERCPLCKGQLIACGCVYEVNGLENIEEEHPDIYKNGPTEAMYAVFDEEVEKRGGFVRWTGEDPGSAECRQLGWFTRSIEKDGKFVRWERCSADDEGAIPDLSRWIREQQRGS